MSEPQGERIARNEQAIRDIRSDLAALRAAARDDHHRLRDVESAVSMMLEAHKKARADEASQYRRMELRLQALTVAVALAALVEPFLYQLATGR